MKLDHQKWKITRTSPSRQFLILFKWLIVALSLAAAPAQAATHSKGNVTLFVHGFGPGNIGWNPTEGSLTLANAINCSGYWGDLPSLMRRQGYTGHFIFVAWYQNASNCDVNLHNWGTYDETLSWVDVGAALSQYIYKNFTSKGIPVDIVAHSMGGMVARSAIYGAGGKAPPYCYSTICDAFSPPIDVGTAITAGSPHAGSNTSIVNTCANLASNQQICKETLPGSKSELWINGMDSNDNIINSEARHPQGKFGTQWITIAAADTSLVHYPPLPCCENPISDGVIDTHSAISMAIPGPDQLIVPGDVSHLEFFSANKGANDAGGANTVIVTALAQDYAWARRNFIGSSWTLFNSALSASDKLTSANGSYTLLQQASDSNLVIYDNAHRPLWGRGGPSVQNARSVMQDDGNLVTYSDYLPAVGGSGSATWSTNTAGNGLSYLGLMDDGNLIIVQTPSFARHFPKQNVTHPGGNYGGKVTWKAFTGPNSPLASASPSSTPGGWCMEVPGGQISDNGHDPVSVAVCNDAPQQNFVIDGERESIRALGRCLTNNGIGQSVTMEPCDGQSHQNWIAELGVIRPADGSKICVEGPGSQLVEGRPLAMASCNGSAEQSWVEPRIKNFAGSGKCLGGANPTTTITRRYWRPAPARSSSNGTRLAGGKTAIAVPSRRRTINQCLDVPNQNFVGGHQLQFFHCSNTPAQDWIWLNDGTIRPAAQPQLCIDVSQSNYNDGTAIQLAPCNGTFAQQWDPPGGLSPNVPSAASPPA